MEVNSLQTLLKRNKIHSEEFTHSALMKTIISPEMSNIESRKRLLGAVQTFSNYFQKVVMLRSVLTENLKFRVISSTHLKEEFDHNEKLSSDRNHQPPTWDPILEATSSWFAWKMFTLNDEERTVLIHLVLENSANIFFHAAHKVMQKYEDTDYFKIHSEVDEKHEKMGYELLENLPADKYLHLINVQNQGWDMLNVVCTRIAELVRS